MACPTCGHTIQKISNEPNNWIWWCPRCGTLIEERGSFRSGESPKLVERCRDFEATLGPRWGDLWHRLGIAESIRPPEERKPQ